MDQTHNDDASDAVKSTGQAAATRWFVLALVVITALVYLPALRGGFIWDDNAHVMPPNLRSLDGLRRIWSEPGATQQYYPLLCTAFWIEYHLWGESPLGYHLANLAFHIAAALLLIRVLDQLRIPGARFAAIIFALHPVQVETVAWVSEQKNTLSTVFYLAALLPYLRFDETRDKRSYALAFGLFLCALLCKSVTATLPAALLVILWWRRGRITWTTDIRPLLPMFLAGIAAGLFTIWFESSFVGARGARFHLTLVDRVLVAGRVPWFYLGKLAWPANLIFIYPRWQISPSVWWQYLFPLATVLALMALFALRKRGRSPLAGVLFFLGTLFPVLGFFNVYPFQYSFVADHFQYLASLGIIVPFAAWTTLRLRATQSWQRTAATLLVVALPAVLAVLSARQTPLYTNAETLYRTTIARNPTCWMAHNNLGALLLERGQLGHEPSQIEGAADEFRETIRLKADHADAHYNLANTLMLQGKTAEALLHYQVAATLLPNDVEVRWSLAQALERQGNMIMAAEYYQQALRIKPDLAAAHYNLANILAHFGRTDEAIDHYRHAVELQPDLLPAQFNLATLLLAAGKAQESVGHYQQVLALNSDMALAHHGLGVAFAKLKEFDRAMNHCAEAVRLDASLLGAQVDLAWLVATQPGTAPADLQRAVVLADHVCQATDHQQPAYLDALAIAQAAAGQFPQAIETATRALELSEKSGNAALTQQIRSRLELYRAGRAYQITGTFSLPSEW